MRKPNKMIAIILLIFMLTGFMNIGFVSAEQISVMAITIGSSALNPYLGQKVAFEAAVAPYNATEKGVVWSSSDENVVTIDAESGIATVVGTGSAIITATSKQNGSITATRVITTNELSYAVDFENMTNDQARAAIGVTDEADKWNILADSEKGNCIKSYKAGASLENFSIGSTSLTDYTLEMDMKLDCSRTNNTIEGNVSLYVRSIDSTRRYIIYYTPADEYIKLQRIVGTTTTTITGTAVKLQDKALTNWSHLKIDCQGDTITLNINGEQIFRGQDTSQDRPLSGKVTMRVQQDGTVYLDNIKITPMPGKKLSLSDDSLNLAVGEKEKLYSEVTPSGTSAQNIIWESSNPAVADCVDGVVTAKGEGIAVITATTEDRGIVDMCAVVVGDVTTPNFSITSLNGSVNNGTREVSITGTTDKPLKDVHVKVLAPRADVDNPDPEDIVYAGSIQSEETAGRMGQFAFDFTLPEGAASGVYKVTADGVNINGKQTAQFAYTSPTFNEDFKNDINDAGTAEEIKDLIQDNVDVLELPEANDRVYGALVGRDFANVDTIKQAFNEAFAIDRINTAMVETMGTILEENAGILNLDISEGSAYSRLPNKQVFYTALRAAGLPLNNMVAFSSGYNKVMAFSAINGVNAGDYTKLSEVLQDYNASYYGNVPYSEDIANLSEVANETVYKHVYDAMIGKNFVAISAIGAAYDAAVGETVLTALNSVDVTTRGKVGKFLSDFNKYFELDLTGDYSRISSDYVTVYNALMSKNFTKFSDVKTAFDAAVQAVIDSGNKPVSHGTSGGGGKKTVITTPLPVTAPTAPVNDVNIIDAGEVSWAKESIEELAAKGIVEGDENGRFRPTDTIRREEFVKMIVNAFNMPVDRNGAEFKDVDPAQWYSPYISSAVNNGIIQGISADNFGVGRELTRQDMAAILYRVAQKHGMILLTVNSPEDFEDKQDIADYAKEAVDAMQKTGIINGVGNNLFAPEDTATRAMAAKILYGILKVQ